MDIAEKAQAKVDDKWETNPFAAGKRGRKDGEKNFVQINIGPRKSIQRKSLKRNRDIPLDPRRKTTANVRALFKSTDRSSSLSVSVDRGFNQTQQLVMKTDNVEPGTREKHRRSVAGFHQSSHQSLDQLRHSKDSSMGLDSDDGRDRQNDGRRFEHASRRRSASPTGAANYNQIMDLMLKHICTKCDTLKETIDARIDLSQSAAKANKVADLKGMLTSLDQ